MLGAEEVLAWVALSRAPTLDAQLLSEVLGSWEARGIINASDGAPKRRNSAAVARISIERRVASASCASGRTVYGPATSGVVAAACALSNRAFFRRQCRCFERSTARHRGQPQPFPVRPRNRTLVEAAWRSGSLITAKPTADHDPGAVRGAGLDTQSLEPRLSRPHPSRR